MPADDSLKRLGGGRWETRDGRFTIEPQSGTWAVVDASQTNELGLPLVRGPFRSLTAAKEAIGAARQTGPVQSPLEARIKDGRTDGRSARGAGTTAVNRTSPGARARAASAATGRSSHADAEQTNSGSAESGSAESGSATSEPDSAPPPPPAEPKWLRDLAPTERRRARDLIERLGALGIAEAERIARAEIALDQPALTRLAVERALRSAVAEAMGPTDIVKAAVDALLSGRDRELEVRWRLVDERGRPLGELDLSEQG